MVHWFRTLFRHQVHAAALAGKDADVRFRVREVAEVARARGAGAHACGLAVFFGEVFVVDAVNAEGALLHDTVIAIIFARAIRTGPRAQLATDARVRIDKDNTVFGTLVGRAGRTNRYAGGFLTVQTGPWKVNSPRRITLRNFVAVNSVEPGAGWISTVGLAIGKRS